VLNHTGKTHLLPFDRQQRSSRTSRENSQATKNTTRTGGDFFRLPEASEVTTKRGLFVWRRTRIILPQQKGKDSRKMLQFPHQDCSKGSLPKDYARRVE